MITLILGALLLGVGGALDSVFRLRMYRIGQRRAILQGGAFNYSRYHRVREEHGWAAWPVYVMWGSFICGILLLIAGFFSYVGTSATRKSATTQSAFPHQQAQKKVIPPACTKMIRVRGSFPKGPFKVLPKELYKRSPLIKHHVQENGGVSDATITRSSGVADIDTKVVDAVAHWEYTPRPAGCGVIETVMSVTIDWGNGT